MKLSRKARPTLIIRIHATLANITGVRSSHRWMASKALFHDYEDDFAEAGLRRESYSDDEEDTNEMSCSGI